VQILLVDDEPSILKAIKRYLMHAGHSVVTCQDARDALRTFETGGFDVAFVDVCMPEGNGLELLRSFRTRRPTVPIFMMSGADEYDGQNISTEAMVLGAAGVLTKPFGMKDLLRALAPVSALARNRD
jgi:DNA-binding response OmpR family regulator